MMQSSGEKIKKNNFSKPFIVWLTVVLLLLFAVYFLFIRDRIKLSYYDETKNYDLIDDMRIESLSEPVPFKLVPPLENLGTASYKQALVNGNQQNLLYPTFDDQDAVFKNLQNKIPLLLSKLEQDYRLGTISEKNIKEYSTRARDYLQPNSDTSGDPVLDNQMDILRRTEHIIANNRSNAEIIDYLVHANPIDPKNVYMLLHNSLYSLDYVEENGYPFDQDEESAVS